MLTLHFSALLIAPRKKKTFKDKQELKSAALQIKMNNSDYD